jgi:ribonuclease P protein component
MKDHSFGKHEKLKSEKVIKSLFAKKHSLFSYPIKLVFAPISEEDKHTLFTVSVPKKKFKRAVDRNRIKRLIREAYRLNKSMLADSRPFAMMAIYVADKELSFQEVEKSIKYLLFRLEKQK